MPHGHPDGASQRQHVTARGGVDVAPHPPAPLLEVRAPGPGGRQLDVLVEPGPAQADMSGVTAEGQVFRRENAEVPAHQVLGSAGNGDALAMDEQRSVEYSLER